MIISFLNPKGGSGKTTISTNFSRAIQKLDYSVLLVDSDIQGSARDWHSALEDNPIDLITLSSKNSLKTLDKIKSNYDFVVIDGSSKLQDVMVSTIKKSDLVIIPIQPSPYDLWAVDDLVELIKTRQSLAGLPRAAFVVSRAIKNTKLATDIMNVLLEYEIPKIGPSIVQRVSYSTSAASGKSVFETDDQNAIKEMSELTNEIIKFAQGEK